MGTHVFILSQILAGLAFACGLASFQFKGRQGILLFLSASCVFNSAHFFVLDRPGAAAVTLLTALRFIVAVFTVDRRAMYFFLFASVTAFFLTFHNSLSYLALFATLLGTYASFLSSDRRMRILIMIGTSTWLIHNVLAVTPVAVAMEASFLISNIIGYMRFYRSPGDEERSVCA